MGDSQSLLTVGEEKIRDEKIYDISPELSADIAVWPGDQPLSRSISLDLDRGDNLTLSSITSTVHLGAHADAPSHYGRGAASIEGCDLRPYLGKCRLITVSAPTGERIPPSALGDLGGVQRVLLRTASFPNPKEFDKDFNSLSVGLIDELARQGVFLVGIDTPSVDPFDSKDLPSHQALLRHGMANLEGLCFDSVNDGDYELIALPLRLVGFDASPVRAVLRCLADPQET